ncbi:Imm27 family immunity protein [Flavobacterium sp.]|uniref:Imm27 family immunity protein n=1 Tax=Flavobacterium sp. TaxID=239 RepID=UPI0008AD3C18|nr:Imm27 family immunity protein [Flavobacterium sp.]OGS61228.1 MAG: hypothetical protein A2X07_06225 [Flavobacteria bacterium GWF1_32_7]HBD27039.1 hypothetical protein [Flavobacterium sp.]
MKLIEEKEKELTGNWIFKDGKIVEDETSKRIKFLIDNFLVKIAVSPSGWEKLFQDPNDLRFWELTYNDGEFHGGGAPSLRNISKEMAVKNYSLNVD